MLLSPRLHRTFTASSSGLHVACTSRRGFRFDFVFSLQALLAGAAFLQGFLGFCAGSSILDYLIKSGWVRESIYRMHTKTRYFQATWYCGTVVCHTPCVLWSKFREQATHTMLVFRGCSSVAQSLRAAAVYYFEVYSRLYLRSQESRGSRFAPLIGTLMLTVPGMRNGTLLFLSYTVVGVFTSRPQDCGISGREHVNSCKPVVQRTPQKNIR